MPINKHNYVLIILPNNLLSKIMFISNYTNVQYEKYMSSVEV